MIDTNIATSQSTILIIDDESSTRQEIETILAFEGYQLISVDNGEIGIKTAARVFPDVILLDINMPGIDGYEVCNQIRSTPALREIPILMMTSSGDRETMLNALNAGADDFLSKPLDPAELRARLLTITRLNRFRMIQDERVRFEKLVQLSPLGILIIDDKNTICKVNPEAVKMAKLNSENDMLGKSITTFLTDDNMEMSIDLLKNVLSPNSAAVILEVGLKQPNLVSMPIELHAGRLEWNNHDYLEIIVRDISDRKLAEQQLEHAFGNIQQSLEETIVAWGRILEMRDFEQQGHTQRVVNVSAQIAKTIGMQDEFIVHLRRGAALHDIGKIGIPDGILLKPASLSEEEWAIMRKHPIYAYDMLSTIFFLMPATLIPLSHHERWNGSGYPQGLEGEDIPIEARIFAVVDVWESLSSDRPYRRAWKEDKIRTYLQQNAGILFDPKIVDVFLNQVIDHLT